MLHKIESAFNQTTFIGEGVSLQAHPTKDNENTYIKITAPGTTALDINSFDKTRQFFKDALKAVQNGVFKESINVSLAISGAEDISLTTPQDGAKINIKAHSQNGIATLYIEATNDITIEQAPYVKEMETGFIPPYGLITNG